MNTSDSDSSAAPQNDRLQGNFKNKTSMYFAELLGLPGVYRIPAVFNSRSNFVTASFGIGSVSHLGKRLTSKPRMRKTSRSGTRPYLRNSVPTRRAAVSTLFCASTACGSSLLSSAFHNATQSSGTKLVGGL